MFRNILVFSLVCISNLFAYTEKNWEVYNACKQNVLEGYEYQDKEGDICMYQMRNTITMYVKKC